MSYNTSHEYLLIILILMCAFVQPSFCLNIILIIRVYVYNLTRLFEFCFKLSGGELANIFNNLFIFIQSNNIYIGIQLWDGYLRVQIKWDN